MHAITVDERMELVSLVFRLAGKNKDYRCTRTRYQRKLSRQFKPNNHHPAVLFARELIAEGGQAFFFAMHLTKDGESFQLLPADPALVARMETAMPGQSWLWNMSIAAKFLPLLNDFYRDTNFAAFFRAQAAYYKRAAERYARKYLSHIDLAWFDRYVNPAQLRCVLLPSLQWLNLGMTVGDLVYAGVCAGYTLGGSVIVHEFCHHFANPIAEQWYAQNSTFNALCDEPILPNTHAMQYTPGLVMACEYVTRAFTVLYHVQHGEAPAPLLRQEVSNGFPHIAQVYDMVKELP
ncbi:MAG: DUF4932 domain-containing protein [Oscillospiraceae bacterium]|nr:DUF4932 domain-containing protein [Oscillospiraceae bacterium]